MVINGKSLKDDYKKLQIVVQFKVNMVEELDNLDFIFTDNNLYICYSNEVPEFEELKELTEGTSHHVTSISNSNLPIPNVTNNHRIESYSNNDLEDLSKDLNSYDNSTNDLMDSNSNTTFEQTIEELRSYISLVGISLNQG